ncbi:MAG: hypothetical protein SO361_10450 [Lachnospira sp.]|nr:hypothetical protein [Lachnospira sp.]
MSEYELKTDNSDTNNTNNTNDTNDTESLITGGSLYENNYEKYKDNMSSAITFFVCGAIGILLLILNDTGIIHIVSRSSSSFIMINIVLGILFIGFIVIGFWSLKYSQRIKVSAVKENEECQKINEWLDANINKEDIENSYSGDIPEEMKYFNRTAYVKEQIMKEFTEVNDDIAQSISDQFIEKTF